MRGGPGWIWRVWGLAALLLGATVASQAQETAIDVLVVYTNRVSDWNGGADGVEAQVQAALVSANEAYSQSKTDVRLRLAGLRKLDYYEQDDMSDELEQLGEKDGAIDEVLDWRDELGADLVCLFRQGADNDNGIGVAWLLKSAGGRADTGFSVVSIDYALSELVFQHEIGHNLGAAHDRDNSSTQGVYDYSYGHRFSVSGSQYRTVMAYDPGYGINYFSNPSIRFEGVATGVASGSTAADNARTFRNVVKAVAGYRAYKPKPPVAQAGADVVVEDEDGDGKATVTLDGTASNYLSGPADFRWTWAGGQASGEVVEVNLAPGRYTITLTVTDREGLKSTDMMSVEVKAYSPVKQVYAFAASSFYVLENGSVKAVGNNSGGSLGIGVDEYSVYRPKLVPVSGIVGIAHGGSHTLFLGSNGRVHAAGFNSYGQLATGGTVASNFPKLCSVTEVVGIAASNQASYFVRSDGSLWAAGSSGIYSNSPWLEPTKIVESGVKSVVASDSNLMFLKEDGSLWAWGAVVRSAREGPILSEAPVAVIESGVTKMALGGSHGVALKVDGSVWVFGESNWGGQLGLALSSTTKPELLVAGGAVDVWAAAIGTAVRLENGEIWVTGSSLRYVHEGKEDGEWLELGRAFGKRAASFSFSGNHGLLMRDDGSVWGFGYNGSGLLWPLSGYEIASPTKLFGPTVARTNESPVAHAGGDLSGSDGEGDGFGRVTLDGGASTDDWLVASYEWTWAGGGGAGRKLEVELPVGVAEVTLVVKDDEGRSSTDTVMVTIGRYSRAVSVLASERRVFVVKEDGSLWAIGNQSAGDFGLPKSWNSQGRWKRLSPEGVVDFSSENSRSVAVCADGSVWTTGSNRFGALGDGTRFDRNEFGRVIEHGAVAASVGSEHTLVVMEDGSLWGMGDDSQGALGLGAMGAVLAPTRLLESGVVAARASGGASFALMEDGSLWAAYPNFDLQGWRRVVDGWVVSIEADGSGGLLFEAADGRFWGISSSVNSGAGGWIAAEEWAPFPIEIAGASAYSSRYGVVTYLDGEGVAWRLGRNNSFNSEFLQLSWERVAAGAVSVSESSHIVAMVMEDGSVWGIGNQLTYLGIGFAGGPDGYLVRLLQAAADDVEPNAPPEARVAGDIEIYAWSSETSQNVVLDGSLSTDDRGIARYEWWINGESRTGRRGFHSFPLGETEVRLVVKDLEGLSDATTFRVTVQPRPEVGSFYSSRDALYVRSSNGALFAFTSGRSEEFGLNPYLSYYYGGGQLTDGVASVALGGSHTLIVKQDGELWGFGDDGTGQLGLGNRRSQRGLVRLPLADVLAAAATYDRSAALRRDGTLWMSGGRGGVFGEERTGVFGGFEVLDDEVVSVAGGQNFFAYVKRDGSVWIAGDFEMDWEREVAEESEPVDWWKPRRALSAGGKEVFAKGSRILLIDGAGGLWGLGSNELGQLGVSISNPYLRQWRRVFESGVSGVSAGSSVTLVWKVDGSLWGMGRHGSNGGGDSFGVGSRFEITDSPKRLLETDIVGGDAGNSYSLILRSDGSALLAGMPESTYFGQYSYRNYPFWTVWKKGRGSWTSEKPVADAGPDLEFYSEYNRVRLSALESRDDWGIESVRWESSSGHSSTNFVFEPYLGYGTHTVSLTVTDGEGQVATDTVTVVVRSVEEFRVWLREYFSVEQVAGMYSPLWMDPDQDGRTNAMEKLLGTDPSVGDPAPLVSFMLTAEGGYVVAEELSWLLNLRLHTSWDLRNWHMVSDQPKWVDETTAVFPIDPDGAQFYRVSMGIDQY